MNNPNNIPHTGHRQEVNASSNPWESSSGLEEFNKQLHAVENDQPGCFGIEPTYQIDIANFYQSHPDVTLTYSTRGEHSAAVCYLDHDGNEHMYLESNYHNEANYLPKDSPLLDKDHPLHSKVIALLDQLAEVDANRGFYSNIADIDAKPLLEFSEALKSGQDEQVKNDLTLLTINLQQSGHAFGALNSLVSTKLEQEKPEDSTAEPKCEQAKINRPEDLGPVLVDDDDKRREQYEHQKLANPTETLDQQRREIDQLINDAMQTHAHITKLNRELTSKLYQAPVDHKELGNIVRQRLQRAQDVKQLLIDATDKINNMKSFLREASQLNDGFLASLDYADATDYISRTELYCDLISQIMEETIDGSHAVISYLESQVQKHN